MLMIAGITITVGIIALGTISISLSTISFPIDKRSYIKPEFDNIRKEFGVFLKDSYGDISQYSFSSINLIFNHSKRIFTSVEALDGYYFNAMLLGYYYKLDKISGLEIRLCLIDDDESVVEDVLYDFSDEN